jgi:pyruvate/2-oxoglutarate/acetoin dehydrogenase E1 component/TPP-dependent pyruvate/acetoin dehydrogenase alpha subunit
MASETVAEKLGAKISFEEMKRELLSDYRLANISREASLLGRKEVLTGKAKFGIFGDGKEIPQIAMAKFFRDGDFRSGYYRDQTFMMATGNLTVQEFFAQLYAHTDVKAEPSSAGRSMNGHFGTRSIDEEGNWKNLMQKKNSSADISPTGSQMPRLLGLALASKLYRENSLLQNYTQFTNKGNEVAFGTIGDASTSEGMVWETINAAGVLQVPMVISVWDDGHGISVPKKYQTTKESISEVLKGFQRDKDKKNGFEIYTVKAWKYTDLIETYQKAVDIAREQHIPVVIHVEEVTQPQGHSTSGSHERYKSAERLQWETDFCCIKKMGEWLVEKNITTEQELNAIQEETKKEVRDAKKAAWEAYLAPILIEQNEAISIFSEAINETTNNAIHQLLNALKSIKEPSRKEVYEIVRKVIRELRGENTSVKQNLINWFQNKKIATEELYSSHLYSESKNSPMLVTPLQPSYSSQPEMVDGRIIIRENFDCLLANDPRVLIFGEDSGKIGGVNQGLEGLQAKHGELRVFDTGIREATILGQGIGLALRGLRPIAEIQYLDYLAYCIQLMSDDLATTRWRTKGGQMAPLLIRTRGHRLEGIWHSGSPMGMIINSVRGIHVCVPRNMTDAAGFYNTLMKGDDPALVIEPLNAYRSKEKMPENIGKFYTPLGVPEIMIEGNDLTIVSYGSTSNIASVAVKQLLEVGIGAELIDCRTLLPFDINHTIVKSLQKTNRLLIVDEDVPGGASAFILQKVLEEQGGYKYLDSIPKTLASKEHRPAYGSDGDYFSKPNVEDIFDAAYLIMHESNPTNFPEIY